MGANRKQHYVSAFYLYHFTNDEQRHAAQGKERRATKIFCYNKENDSIDERPIKKTCIVPNLLSFKTPEDKYDDSLDDIVKNVESNAATALAKLDTLATDIFRNKKNKIRRQAIADSLMDSLLEFIFWQIKKDPEQIEYFESCFEKEFGPSPYPGNNKRLALEVVKTAGKAAKGESDEFDIVAQLRKKNKTLLVTESSNFITTDNPFVRFNKNRPNGISVEGTEIYMPLTRNLFLFMRGDGDRKEIRFTNDRKFLRELNSYMGCNAKKYIFSPNKTQLERIVREVKKYDAMGSGTK